MKLNRTYTIEIQTNPVQLETLRKAGLAGGSYTGPNVQEAAQKYTITITDPLTIQFTVNTAIKASAHRASIIITNLNKSVRDLIYKDKLDKEGDRLYKPITFSAGYGAKQTIIFQGNIEYAYSERPGTEWKTTISAYDGSFAMQYGESHRSYERRTKVADILNDLIDDCPTLSLGYMSSTTDTMEHAVFAGKSWEYIEDIWSSKYGPVYVDREKVFLTTEDEVINAGAVVIDASSGLLEVPKKFGTRIDIKTLFEPSLRMGQLVRLESQVKECNGDFKIVGMNHIGTISGAVSGELVTSLMLWDRYGQPFRPLIKS